jgi:hypothetical protein
VHDRPVRNPETAFREVADEGGLVVLPSRSEVKVLNPVGSKVYSMLDGTHTVDEIIAAVVEEFDVNEADARRDVEGFLAELDSQGMLGDGETQAVDRGRAS